MKRDNIDEILKKKLYDTEPSKEDRAPAWDKFESRLRRRKTIKHLWYYATASVAATVGIFVLTSSPEIDSTQKTFTPIAVINSFDPETKSDDTPTTSTATNNLNPTKSIKRTSGKIKVAAKPNSQDTDVHVTAAVNPTDNKKTEDTKQSKTNNNADDIDKWQRPNWRSKLEIGTAEPRSNRKMALLAYSNIPNGAGGINTTPGKYDKLAQGTVVLFNSTQQVIVYGDNELNHKFPLTFGVSLSLALNEKLSLESGLAYTYLESSVEAESILRYTQKIHYLGIPVSATFKFVDSKTLDFYGSVGVMAEVALSAKGKTERFGALINSVETNNIKTKGIQFSANAALGVNFHLNQNLGLYIEPGISTYLKNPSQPATYRTQSAFQFNLKAGFKIQL